MRRPVFGAKAVFRGIVDAADAAAAGASIEERLSGGKVPTIVSAGFQEHAVSENSYAGFAMGRRAASQYGGYLEKGPRGALAMGIGNG